MRFIALLTACTLAWTSPSVLAFGTANDDETGLGPMLALVHSFVRLAAQSEDPRVVEKGVDDMLAGRNSEANRAAEGLMRGMTEDMSSAEREAFAALAQDLLVLARREHAKALEQPRMQVLDAERALAARKELHAMGLRYYDAGEFLDAVKRDDALAVALYIEARGVNLGTRDADGRSAVEIAQAKGNQQIAGMLSGVR